MAVLTSQQERYRSTPCKLMLMDPFLCPDRLFSQHGRRAHDYGNECTNKSRILCRDRSRACSKVRSERSWSDKCMI